LLAWAARRAPLHAGATVTSLVFLWCDVASWSAVRAPRAFSAALGLHLAASATIGVGVVLAVELARALEAARGSRIARGALAPIVAFAMTSYALAAPLVARATATKIAFTVLVYAIVLLAVAYAWTLVRALAARRHARVLPALVVASLALAADKTCLVALYERAHHMAELLSVGLFALVGALAGRAVARAGRARRLGELSLVALTWLAVLAVARPARALVERALPNVWEQQVYTARWLRRMHTVEAVFARGAHPLEDVGLRRLFARYEIHDVVVAPRWGEDGRAGQGDLASPERPLSVVVFFVDALRADTAGDPAVMPTVAAWMERSVSFSRAYGVGSSTVLSLVPLLGCRYDRKATDPPSLLEAARSAGYATGLFIPRAAREFHGTYYPSFRFDHEEVTDDYVGKRVPTAERLVDQTLAWLGARGDAPSFAWTYQYDVHSWGDLDPTYVRAVASEGGLPMGDGLAVRYHAAARGVDQAFAKLLAGLERLGIQERTVVVLVSDHGEALGERQFWIHSTYLWESLLRVPMGVSVPGQPARRVDTPVSLIDLGPTLAGFIPFSTAGCHGEDVLREGGPSARRFPILFSAVSESGLARVGILGEDERKLVVDVLSGDARLFRISAEHLHEEDVTEREPSTLARQLDTLVTSPLFPK